MAPDPNHIEGQGGRHTVSQVPAPKIVAITQADRSPPEILRRSRCIGGALTAEQAYTPISPNHKVGRREPFGSDKFENRRINHRLSGSAVFMVLIVAPTFFAIRSQQKSSLRSGSAFVSTCHRTRTLAIESPPASKDKAPSPISAVEPGRILKSISV